MNTAPRLMPTTSRLLLKRGRQLGRLSFDLVGYWQCKRIIRRAAVTDPWTPFKYLGDYLTLSLSTAERRRALAHHYALMTHDWNAVVWELKEANKTLNIHLERARFAPMEGELQLRFSAGDRALFMLTFLLAPGELFGGSLSPALFIGGAQGGTDCRIETRRAAKLNGEIAPAAMLLLAVRAMAKTLNINQIFAVATENRIAQSYASEQVKLDYNSFWSQAGGERHGAFYQLPLEGAEKPLYETPITHRARTRRKRERKRYLRDIIEARFRALFTGKGSPC